MRLLAMRLCLHLWHDHQGSRSLATWHDMAR